MGSCRVDLHFVANLSVIWAIGVSMIALAAFVHFVGSRDLGLGLLIVCGYNDPASPKAAYSLPSTPSIALAIARCLSAGEAGLKPGTATPRLPCVRYSFIRSRKRS